MTTIGPGITRQNAVALQGVPISTTLPTDTQVLKYVAATNLWTPSTDVVGTGTVTSIVQGTGMSFSVTPIVTTGTINLANTAVTPGAYTFASITVDQQGRLTAAASGFKGVLAQLANDITLDGSDKQFSFTTPDYDTSSFWAVGTPNIFTIPAGVSKIVVSIHGFLQGATGAPGGIYMTVNAANPLGRAMLILSFTALDVFLGATSAPLRVAANDVIRVFAGASSGTLKATADSWASIQAVQ